MTIVLIAFAGLIVGFALGWLVSSLVKKAATAGAPQQAELLSQQLEAAKKECLTLRDNLLKATAERMTAQSQLADEKKFLEEAHLKLADTFKSLAAEALHNNNQDFLTIAEDKFKGLKKDSVAELETREKAIDMLVKPLLETISKYQEETRKFADSHREQFGKVSERLESIAVANSSLQNETAKLVNALKRPQVRGRWGEITLRNTAELAGMAAYCDFVEQETVATETGNLRPDMVVKLPSDREIVVDSKVPLDAFLTSLEARTDEERETALRRHADQVYTHIDKLASKKYWEQFPTAPDFVVLFIPNDSFLAAAAEKRPTLIEEALAKNVVIATPTTFIALLKAVAYGWKQQKVSETARRIFDLGMELSERIGIVAKHLNNIGEGLGSAMDAYNEAVGSIERRLLTTARKFKELGASEREEIEELQPVEKSLRSLAATKELEDKDKD
jgi:DNA recombination protein RmuC